jgi:hypothetical protein
MFHHLELAEPNNSWVYVSERYEDYPGKVKSNTIVRCLTQEGQWLKDALSLELSAWLTWVEARPARNSLEK